MATLARSLVSWICIRGRYLLVHIYHTKTLLNEEQSSTCQRLMISDLHILHISRDDDAAQCNTLSQIPSTSPLQPSPEDTNTKNFLSRHPTLRRTISEARRASHRRRRKQADLRTCNHQPFPLFPPPSPLQQNTFLDLSTLSIDSPINPLLIGGWYFSFFLIALSGLPRLAASDRA